MTSFSHPLRRTGALLLALLLVLSSFAPAALATGYEPPLVFSLNWLEGDMPMEAQSVPVTEPGYENCYWLYAPANAIIFDAALNVRDVYSQYAFLSIPSGMPLSQTGYTDAFDLGGMYLDVIAYDAYSQPITQCRLYISTQNPVPVSPSPAPVYASVPVYYVDQNGQTVATGSQSVGTGDNYVYPDASMLPAGYSLTTFDSMYVSVDAYGNCNPGSVTFYCRQDSVETFVPVYYFNMNGAYLTETTAPVRTGDNTVYADPNLVPGYSVEGSVHVTVDAYGMCSPNAVTFYCTQNTVETFVPVYYFDMNGNYLTETTAPVRTGDNTVYADANLVPGYSVEGSMNVNVDAYGICNPNSVTFYCKQNVVETFVPVYYFDANGNYLTETTVSVRTGDNTVYADPNLVPGYSVEGSMNVTVDAYGICNPNSVTFYCKQNVVETFVPVYYFDANGNYLTETTAPVRTGDNTVYADANLVPGYSVEGSMNVNVDAYGICNPNSVTFYCKQNVVETFVPVYYFDANGNYLTETTAPVRTGDNTVYADANLVPGYSVEGSMNVNVDTYGICNPNSVTFYCKQNTVETFVPVYYFDANGNYLTETTAPVRTGDNTVYADPNLVPGYSVEGSMNVNVDAYGICNPNSVTFYCKQNVVETFIPVYYFDANGNYLTETTAPVRTGDNTVYADANLVPGYSVEGSMNVTVDAYGICNPNSVIFYCTKNVVETAVPVYYVDQNNQTIAFDSQPVKTGDNFLFPNAAMLPAGYELTSLDSVYVTVDENGVCSPEAVTFHCRLLSVETSVPVYYFDMNGVYLTETTAPVRTGDNTVYADPSLVPGYSVEGSVNVKVDVYGICDPGSITFYCVQNIAETFVPVYYFDNNGNYLTETTFPVRTGENVVTPDLSLVPQYEIDGEETVTVTVDAFGVCTPVSAVFYFKPVVQPTLEPTLEPTIEPTLEPTLEPTVEPTLEPTVEPTLAPTETPAPAQAFVTVRYVNSKNETVYSETVLCMEGDTYIAPQESVLTNGYTLENDIPAVVSVSADGTATPAEVVFRCQGGPPEATPQPVNVPVYYLDQNNNPVASATFFTCYEGITPVRPAPTDLMENYVLSGDDVYYVVVTEHGAEPASVTFFYSHQAPATPAPTQPPAPKVALVPVIYRTTAGEVFYTDNAFTCTQGENLVTPNPAYVPAQYQLRSDGVVRVMVDENGMAIPASVEFAYFTGEIERNITVYYKDPAGNDVASPQIKPCYLGSNILACEPIDLRPGYRLTSPEIMTVMLDESGTLTHNGQVTDSVVFYFEAPPTPTPLPTPLPYVLHPAEGYCYPKSDTINFRSEPSTTSDESILRTVMRNELGIIEGYVINERNEQWYVVTIGDQTGFLRENVVRLLTNAEINELFGYTPTPAPTMIPDFTPIDRWGKINDRSVNFRASIGGTRLTYTEQNAYIFVYDSETQKNSTWYRANYKGMDGYIMAQFVDLLSEEESRAYQQTLSSPMPVRTATPSPVPATPTPTVEPITPTPYVSPTPAVIVTASPTPAPYAGYALTTRAVDLRTGISIGDTTLATLPANSLVYLFGQAYVDGMCWNSAESLYLNVSGYLPDNVLRRITREEAEPYLAALQPQLTPTPVPTPQPAPFTGYAVTNGVVMLRSFSSDKAEIIEVLSEGEVVWILAQEYVDGEAWQIVRFKNIYGYIRGDQLLIMTPEEQLQYEETLRTATPAPQPTPSPAPVTQESTTSYGYVTTDNVRLRSGAGTDKGYIRLLNRYAFALVYGSEYVDGKLWYHVNQAGTDGYIMGDYFKVLNMGELSEFLTSDEYRQSQDSLANGNQGNSSGSGTIVSPEDYNFNVNIWQTAQPGGATYNPFMELLATPTPNVEQIATPTPAPTAVPTVLPTTNFQPFITPAPNAGGGSGNGWIYLALAGVAIVAGGGIYAYSIHRQNQRRAAQRAAQRRAQQQAARAYQRPQQQYPQQMQGAQTYQSPFTPPQPRGMNGMPDGQNPYTTPPAQGNASSAQRNRRSNRHQS